MNDDKNYGVDVIGVVTIVFVILKLCNLVDYSWLVIFSPMLISLALIIIIVIVAIVYKLLK